MEPPRRFRSNDVIDVLAHLFIEHGPPEHFRSDDGPEFVTNAVREWPGRLAVTTLYIAPASLWAKGYIERFNARLREALRNGEIFYSLAEVRTVTGWWRDHYNRTRPHCSLTAASDVDHRPRIRSGCQANPDLTDWYGNEDDWEALQRGFQGDGGTGANPGAPDAGGTTSP